MSFDSSSLGALVFALLLLLTFLLLRVPGESDTRTVARTGVLLSLSLVLGAIESMLPEFFLPGFRFGLSNVVLLFALWAYGAKMAFFLALGKALLGSMLRGSFLAMGGYMALAGTLLSFLLMALLHRYARTFSIVGVSVVGAIGHVMGQLAVAYLFLGSPILGYAPALLLTSFGTGVLTGLLSLALSKNKALLRYLR